MSNVIRTISCSILAVISVLIMVYSNICYAGRTTEDVTVSCARDAVSSLWILYNRGLDATLTLTTVGMYIKDLDKVVGKWQDDDEEHDYENAYDYNTTYGMASAIAQCVPPGGAPILGDISVTTKMYDYEQNEAPPSLSCPMGYAVAVRYLRPFNADTTKFAYKAILTVDRPDKKKVEEQEKVSVKGGDKLQQSDSLEEKKMSKKSKDTGTTEKKGQQPSKCTQFCNQGEGDSASLSIDESFDHQWPINTIEEKVNLVPDSMWYVSNDNALTGLQQGYDGIMGTIQSVFSSLPLISSR